MAKVQASKAGKKKPAKKNIAKKVASKKAYKTVVVKPAGKIVFKADKKQTAILVRVGRAGATNAIRASKALGLPITYIEKGSIIQELPNGVKKIVTAVTGTNTAVSSLKKGMIFHAKK
jgi:hypothetical protein